MNIKSFILTGGQTDDTLRLRRRHATGRIVKIIARSIFLIGMSYVMLYPVLFVLSASFKTLEDMYNPTVIWVPQTFSLQATKIASQILNYPAAIVKTLKITIPSVCLQVFAVLLAGYGFARFKFPGRSFFFGLLVFTIIVPVQSYIIPLYVNLKNFNYFGIGSLAGLFTGRPLVTNLLDKDVIFYIQAVFGMGIRSGLCIFIMRQFFRNLPVELEEAAMIDGCGPFSTFLRVMVPNTLPLITTVFVFSIVWYWNDYYLSSMFYRTEFPVSVNLTLLNTLLTTSDNVVNAVSGISSQELFLLKEPILSSGCLITILPVILMYIFAQRYFTEGVERSGIVG